MRVDTLRSLTLALTASAVAVLVAAGAATGCAGTSDGDFSNDTSTTTTTGPGGSGGSATGGSGGSGTGASTSSACGTDCSLINTPQCQVAQCNTQTKQCEVVNDEEGVACDDGLFCTISDSCSAGTCVGGPQNDCGMAPPQCTEVTCDESSQTCSSAPSMNGAACQDPNDLCVKGSTCSNGLCIGGQQDDCFFFPVPSDCHVATCNPMSGMCEAETGNENGPCNDSNDLCTVDKICDNMGMCGGGNPKNCSQLTQGCNLGVCDVNTGQCVTQAVMNGQLCDDLNGCTTGEICTNSTCAGGTPVTACTNNDGCCPSGCTQNNDTDCGCGTNLALTATGSHSGGGSTTFGPSVWNDGVTEMQCPSCQGWVSNTTTANGSWIQYDWNGPVMVGSIWIDGNTCNLGRTVDSGEVQTWTNNQWVTRNTFTGQDGNFGVNISPPVSTTKVRIFNITAGVNCPQTSNSLLHEWWVFPGTNCAGQP
jgi:hypothetical protein